MKLQHIVNAIVRTIMSSVSKVLHLSSKKLQTKGVKVNKQFDTQEFDENEDVDMELDKEELNLDEDEAYVRETGGMSEGEEDGVWIGDEFVGLGDDEELEDYDITEIEE